MLGLEKTKVMLTPDALPTLFSRAMPNVTFLQASKKVTALITNTWFEKDVAKLSPSYQTSCCEAFHSVVLHFAPNLLLICWNAFKVWSVTFERHLIHFSVYMILA